MKNIYGFIEWTKIKIRLHLRPNAGELYFKKREIWWASLGVNIGFEMDGKHENFERPILIIKVFSRDVLLALPATSKKKIGKYYFQTYFAGNTGTIILSQLRLISSKRLLRKIGMISESDFNEITKQLRNYFK